MAWKKGDSYGAIAQSYADFNIRLYGKATVVSMVNENVHPSKTIRIRDVVKTLTPLLTSMQRQSLWEERMISFPDLATNKVKQGLINFMIAVLSLHVAALF